VGTCFLGWNANEGIFSVSLSSGSSDEVLEAINALTTALDRAAVDQQAMAAEALRMRRARSWKDSWLAALPPAGQPNLVSLSTRALAGLSAATSRVRTSLARALRAEGLTVREIAAVFGVSHQRISELLARTARPAEAGGVPAPEPPAAVGSSPAGSPPIGVPSDGLTSVGSSGARSSGAGTPDAGSPLPELLDQESEAAGS
jgi:hypothetical protein